MSNLETRETRQWFIGANNLLITILLGIVAFFLIQMYNRVEEIAKEQTVMKVDIGMIKTRVGLGVWEQKK